MAEGALRPFTSNIPYHVVSVEKEYLAGEHHVLVVPAGIGRQEVASIKDRAEGNMVLNAVSFWGTGGVMSRERT